MKKRSETLGVIYAAPGLSSDIEDRIKAAREFLLRKRDTKPPANTDDHAEKEGPRRA